MRATEDLTRTIIAEEAAEWFVANREGLDAAQRAQFAAWLKRSPTHVQEYLAMAQMARQLPRAAVDPEMSMEALVERARTADDISPPKPDRTRTGYLPRLAWLQVATAAAIVAMVGLGTLWWSGNHSTQPTAQPLQFAAGHGEQLTRRLEDDSVLHLNTDTAVLVRFGQAERQVEIQHGQAVFEVAHDVARPFRVIAGSAQVVAVGTKFDVYIQPGYTLVTVVEGRVLVSQRQPQLGAAGTVPVAAGQQLRVVAGLAMPDPYPVDTERATAWLHRKIVFEKQPLLTVAEEFNRYSTKPIVIESPELRRLVISGSFATDDTESFIAFLRTLEGVRVEVTTTGFRVSRN
jgi:transmembrane sensor